MIDIRETGADAVARLLGRVPAAAEGAQREIVGNLGTAWLGALKGETPLGKGENSPNLVRQYEIEQRYSPQAAIYQIANTTPYLPYVIHGRGPVEAKPGRYLRFSIGGVVFFRKRVRGTKPNPFPTRARAKVAGQIATATARLAAAVIRRARG